MIECPWCSQLVEILNGRCPYCKKRLHQVTEDDFYPESEDHAEASESWSELSVNDTIENRFKCAKCSGTECRVQEVAMTGTGLSKLFDIQHHHYLFVSCLNCGFVEVYDPNILQGHKAGKLGTIMDILFGG